MRKALLILMAILLVQTCAHAEKSAVLVIVDGLGSTYIYPDRSPACADGSPLPAVCLDVVNDATARYELWVPTPETEAGNAVIVTGYSAASEDTVSYYGATIYDVLRSRGYLTMAILETGDTAAMIAKPDIAVYERNNSIYSPAISVAINTESVSQGIRELLAADPVTPAKKGTDPAGAYQRYDDWSFNKAIGTIRYMNQSCPGQRYLLVVNVAGTDMAAQDDGFACYSSAIKSLDPGLQSLANACRNAGIVMVVTADHGMGFATPGSRGTHASGAASRQNETRLAPMLIFADEKRDASRVYGQQCLAPTLLSLMECPNTLSVADGVPVPGAGDPSLYLVSDGPVDVTVESPGFYRQTTVNGTCRIGPLAPGRYRVTTPWGVRTAEVAGDVTIRLAGTSQGGMPAGSWVPYVATAVVAAAGIALGLGLTRRNGNRRGRK